MGQRMGLGEHKSKRARCFWGSRSATSTISDSFRLNVIPWTSSPSSTRFKTVASTTVTLSEQPKGFLRSRAQQSWEKSHLLIYSLQELPELSNEPPMVKADAMGLLSNRWVCGLRKIYWDVSFCPRLVHHVAVAQKPIKPFQTTCS